ncbi:hypothetical protein CREGCYN_02820 [Synechococcus sp. M16CYN]
MPFDRPRKLVFLHIPKTAGTSIEQALNLYGPWDQENLTTGFGLIKSRDLLARNLSSNFLQHLRLVELEQLFPEALEGAQLFTVVRDPWQRLLSSFRNQDPDLARYYRYRTHRELSSLNLAGYIDLARWLPHPHMRSQFDFLSRMGSKYSHSRVKVFHQERLEELERWLSEYYGESIRLPHNNPTRQPLPELPNAELQALEQQVRWLYAVDNRAFGYMNG